MGARVKTAAVLFLSGTVCLVVAVREIGWRHTHTHLGVSGYIVALAAAGALAGYAAASYVYRLEAAKDVGRVRATLELAKNQEREV